jgi:hypothetical protein
MDDDDTALDGGADVGPVNLWMRSLFSDVSVSLNENLVCTALLWAVNAFRDVNPLLSVVLLS